MSILGTLLADATLQMHRQVGKVYPGTLRVRGASDTFTSVTWGAYYLEPVSEQTALGGDGIVPASLMLHLYYRHETNTPQPDDLFWDLPTTQAVAAGTISAAVADRGAIVIKDVNERLNGDTGIANYDCRCIKLS